jgi:hypothetical protein
LAAIFITMAPIASPSGGSSGNSHFMSGFNARAMAFTRPAASAMRIMPSHSIMMPIRLMASSMDIFAQFAVEAVMTPIQVFASKSSFTKSCLGKRSARLSIRTVPVPVPVT